MEQDRAKQMAQQDKKIKETLSKIEHKVVVMSGKGGVGKSTVTSNIAYGLAQKGYKVGILDADLHGPNIPVMFGGHGKYPQEPGKPYRVNENLVIVSLSFYSQNVNDPAVWRGPAKIGVIRQLLSDINWGKLDYLLIDLPPGTGDEPLTIAQTITDCDGCVIVTTPQEVALADTRKSIGFAGLLQMKVLGLVENMSGFVCPHCGKQTDIFYSGGGEKTAKEYNLDFLGKIPLNPQIMMAGDKGTPHIASSQGSPFVSIVEQIEKKIENKEG